MAVTAGWGLSFIIIKDAVDGSSAADFLAFRFAVAAVALLAIRPGAIRRLSRPQALRAGLLGVLYGAAQLLQTVGLQHLSASVSGFVTGLYVVLTPIFAALVFRRRVGRNAWIAVAIATAGLAILSLQGFTLGRGDALTLAAAALYAFHILGLGAWSEPRDAYAMATVQTIVITAVCTLAALPGGLRVPHSVHAWWPIIFTGLVESALALLVQTWAQAHLSPTRAAVIMTGEPVFAAFFAIVLGGEPLTWRLVGGVPVVAAMLLAESDHRPDDPVSPHLAEGP